MTKDYDFYFFSKYLNINRRHLIKDFIIFNNVRCIIKPS